MVNPSSITESVGRGTSISINWWLAVYKTIGACEISINKVYLYRYSVPVAVALNMLALIIAVLVDTWVIEIPIIRRLWGYVVEFTIFKTIYTR